MGVYMIGFLETSSEQDSLTDFRRRLDSTYQIHFETVLASKILEIQDTRRSKKFKYLTKIQEGT